jgi:hypothetical protein
MVSSASSASKARFLPITQYMNPILHTWIALLLLVPLAAGADIDRRVPMVVFTKMQSRARARSNG